MSVFPRLVLANLLLTLGVLLGFTFGASAFLFVPILCIGALMRWRRIAIVPLLTTTFLLQIAGLALLFVAFGVGMVLELTWLQVLALLLMFGCESYLDFARIRNQHNEPQT